MHRLQVPRGAAVPLIDDQPETLAAHPGTPHPSRGPFLVAAVVVALDQVTKLWAVAALEDGPVRLIGETLQLRLTRNPGGAFSILTGFTPVLAALAAVMTVVIVRTTRRTSDRGTAYALALVLGGAVGNLVDRFVRDPGVLRGEVIDFIRLSFWPTFNLADSAITIGVLLIVARGWRA